MLLKRSSPPFYDLLTIDFTYQRRSVESRVSAILFLIFSMLCTHSVVARYGLISINQINNIISQHKNRVTRSNRFKSCIQTLLKDGKKIVNMRISSYRRCYFSERCSIVVKWPCFIRVLNHQTWVLFGCWINNNKNKELGKISLFFGVRNSRNPQQRQRRRKQQFM